MTSGYPLVSGNLSMAIFLVNHGESKWSSNFWWMESMGGNGTFGVLGQTTAVKIAAVCQRSWGTTPSQMRQLSKFEHVPGPMADPWVPSAWQPLSGLMMKVCFFTFVNLKFSEQSWSVAPGVRWQSFSHPPWSGYKFHDEKHNIDKHINIHYYTLVDNDIHNINISLSIVNWYINLSLLYISININ